MNSDDAPRQRSDLQKQYELVLQQYRFQVQLNWDRAKHFLIFNTAVFAIAVAVHKDGSTPLAKLGVAALLMLSMAGSFVGQYAVGEGHKIVRAIRSTKTRLEELLELGDLAIPSIAGMKRGPDEAPDGTPNTGKTRKPSVTLQLQALLVLIAAFSALGAGYAGCEAATGDAGAPKAPEAAASSR